MPNIDSRQLSASRQSSATRSADSAFGVMYLLGFSLNNLSLIALTIATGFVVDDAIVMIENISRLKAPAEQKVVQKGASPLFPPCMLSHL